MKKPVRILSLTLAVLMLLAVLVSCGAPAKDPAKAEAALEKENYLVSRDDKYQPELFQKAGYDLNTVLTASKTVTDEEGGKHVEYMSVYYFADKKNAENAMNEVSKYAKNDKEAENTADDDWIAPTRSGAMIYYGTKAAIKAAK